MSSCPGKQDPGIWGPGISSTTLTKPEVSCHLGDFKSQKEVTPGPASLHCV
jgi:hypothetical protein